MARCPRKWTRRSLCIVRCSLWAIALMTLSLLVIPLVCVTHSHSLIPHSPVISGGGLAFLTVQKMSSVPLPLGLAVFSPWLDLSMSGASWHTAGVTDWIVRRQASVRCAGVATGESDARRRSNPLFSPLFGSVARMPRHVFISASNDESLFSESEQMCRKLRESKEWKGTLTCAFKPGMPHAWLDFAGFLPEADLLLSDVSQEIRHWFS